MTPGVFKNRYMDKRKFFKKSSISPMASVSITEKVD